MKLKLPSLMEQALVQLAIQGLQLEPGRWARTRMDTRFTTDPVRVCACGALLIAAGKTPDQIRGMTGEQVLRAVAKRRGITLAQAVALNNGFEGMPNYRFDNEARGAAIIIPGPLDKTWYAVGKSLRRAWQKKTQGTWA